MRHLIAIVLTIFLSSCIRMGDGVLMFEGELIGLPSEEKCVLSISLESEEKALPWKTAEISGVFSDGFTVSPYSKEYEVRISCNGNLASSRIVNYPRDIGIDGVIDLGKISVQW